jgi:hypothetical protein
MKYVFLLIVFLSVHSHNPYSKFAEGLGYAYSSESRIETIFDVREIAENNFILTTHSPSHDNSNGAIYRMNKMGVVTQSLIFDKALYPVFYKILWEEDAFYVPFYDSNTLHAIVQKYNYNFELDPNFNLNVSLENGAKFLSVCKIQNNYYAMGYHYTVGYQHESLIVQFNPKTGDLQTSFHDNGIGLTTAKDMLISIVDVGNGMIVAQASDGYCVYNFSLDDLSFAPLTPETVTYCMYSNIELDGQGGFFTAGGSSPDHIYHFTVKNRIMDRNLLFNGTGSINIAQLGFENITCCGLKVFGNKLFLSCNFWDGNVNWVVFCFDITDINQPVLDKNFFDTGFWFYSKTYGGNLPPIFSSGVSSLLLREGLIKNLFCPMGKTLVYIPLGDSFAKHISMWNGHLSNHKNMKERKEFYDYMGIKVFGIA